jgi:hypothetical protein
MLKMDPWTVCRPVVTELHHFDELQDLDSGSTSKSKTDPHQSKKMDPRIRNIGLALHKNTISRDLGTRQFSKLENYTKRENLKDFSVLFQQGPPVRFHCVGDSENVR